MPRSIGHVTVVAVGKLRERHWLDAQDEYARRLSRYTDFRLVEVKDAVGRSMPDAAAMVREGEQLLAAIPAGARIILMDAGGKRLSSPELAAYLQAQLESYGELAFLIGGPLGFAPAVAEAAHDRLSLSPMTFTHEMARVILLEQLYRAFTILHGEPYHK
ncbi:MAG TPA: 23S rRNA (pseudouridine(1915)-N(3))-methyltransferase RlmH [Promineifilum sp.]|nr:23S rRNA (pseudouridine(1915)-N(3))-methyltransferase RlmH [Promineifilum sp.]HNS40972.1 23S rRNA (pseudouridine(1915)-N(3))-methyltransferase RlmH [Promineifilum sp.]